MKHISVCTDTLSFLKLMKKLSDKELNTFLSKQSVDRLFQFYKVFLNTKKTNLEIKKTKIPKKQTTLLEDIKNNKKKLIECDPKFKEIEDLNQKQLMDWIIKNQTNINLFNCLKLDRGDKFLNRLLYDNPFIPINVLINLEKHNLVSRKVSHNNIDIHCFEKEESKEKLDLEEVYKVANILRVLTGKVNKKLVLVFGMTDFKKKIYDYDNYKNFVDSEIVFKPIYVNSGSSYKGRYINMWRKEEFYKVLIHELIHFLEIDIKFIQDSKKIEDYLRSKIQLTGYCNPSEIYTESLAVLLHTIYVCSKLMYTNFNKMLNKEIKFSLIQVNKLLEITNSVPEKIKINQTTDVCSYFIFKTILMLDLDKFIKFLRPNLDFGSRPEEFIKMLETNYSKFQELLIKTKSKIGDINENKSLLISMRMTCLEIKLIND